MKKYLMTGIAALAMCFGFTSCSHDVEPASQEDLNKFEAQKIVDNYNQAFIKTFGQPAANQTWGFGGYASARTYTRGTGAGNVYKPDMTGYPNYNDAHKYDYPAPITDGEREFVEDWFNKNTGFTQGLNISNFYVQHVSATVATRNGLFHGYEQNRVKNGYDSNYYTEPISQEGYLDKLEVGSAQNLQSTQHIFDFNRQNVGDWDNVYVSGGSALQFGVHSSWGTDESSPNKDGYYWYFKCASITVPGEKFKDGVARTAYYVGICYYGKAVETWDAQGNPEKWRELGNENVAAQRCEDWILKIIPGEPIPEPDPDNVCIIAEDLSANDATDFDFNDVIFTVEYTSTTTAKVTLYAAGGTLPLKVAGTEVHQAFGYGEPDENGLYKMINTGAKANVNGVAPVVLFESLTVDKSQRGNDIEILVDKGTKNAEGVHVPNWIPLTATGGAPAAKLCVGTDYATDPAGPKWCAERESIKDKYAPFTDWVANNPTLIWWK